MWLSTIALLPWLLDFPPQAFATMISSLTSAWLYFHSQQQFLLWYYSTIPKLQLAAAAPSKGPESLSRVYMAAARTVWFSFHLGCHRPAVSLNLKCFSSDSDNYPNVGTGPLLQFPHLLRAGPVLLTLLFFPLVLLSYQVLYGLYILFHWSDAPFCSQLVFCMHFCVWRCIPDVSMETDVLHGYLLLCHLVLSSQHTFLSNIWSFPKPLATKSVLFLCCCVFQFPPF